MGNSLLNELLKAGVVTEEQAEAAARPKKPVRQGQHRGQGQGQRSDGGGRSGKGKRSRRRPAGRVSETARPASETDPARVEEERIKALNLRIRALLDGHRANVDDAETPYHFARGERIKKLYVTPEQRAALASGDLGIVGFRGRHHLVPRAAAEEVRALRPEVFVHLGEAEADAPDGDGAVEDPYAAFEVPDDLVW